MGEKKLAQDMRGYTELELGQPYVLRLEHIGVRELNQNTSAALQRVRDGHAYTVTDRGVPIAHLIPVQPGDPVLDQLVSTGRARPPQIPQGPVPMPPVLGDSDVDSAAALAADREDERW
ncbi:type II toxin-antitoxin system prevent-host-death family antitoxin [Allokutzneria sp. A3M-2-11 16]|uniref:type II toxin-antitoxin system Phd/YefM family antitoxin n=1 Tax=Allokutzneria sp. A3M-2-11 16 TaxID=2962043 RepID=UPI0020B63981|nr:type II toxin-antitoxin system prevent-host-death family antitoxin [Allokutzneria sp. A3M-2-11 16]MCP3802506.1 type II toxin-antitoxin system prevent-host-death family antitoxin [Allokutzneria sp. A3M-2-11 16]